MRTEKLSIYLIKKGIDRLNIIKNIDATQRIKITITGTHSAELFIKPSTTKPPAWLSFFQDAISSKDINLKTASTSAVLILETIKKQKYAITFGYGHSMLEPGCFEERFGLKTTLNSIDSNSIKSIDKKTFSTLYKHTRDQASREGNIMDFGIDVDQDMIRAVTGTPLDPTLASRLAGSDTLYAHVKTDLAGLPGYLDRYYVVSNKETYKNDFAWIDNIAELNDSNLIQKLNSKLIEKINSTDHDRLWLAVPDIVDWKNISGFKYRQSNKDEMLFDIDIDGFISSLPAGADTKVDIDLLERKKILAYNVEGTSILDHWSAFKCIYCEIDYYKKTYLLNGGKWYRIDNDYVEYVNRFIKGIRHSTIDLPDYSETMDNIRKDSNDKEWFSEKNYIIRACNENKNSFALMDQKKVYHGGGHSAIEFCDIYTKDKKIIHIKRYGYSSVLSHLFNQGLVSGRLFSVDSEFRAKLNKVLPKNYKLDDPNENIPTSDYEIVYAIVSTSNEKKLTLPFFSRVSLMHAVQNLRGYRYKVSLKKINVVD
jgi:uncharacterized protein (TIGR04141 family)